MHKITKARENRQNQIQWERTMERELYLASKSYRNREPEHAAIEKACRKFFRAMGVKNKFGWRYTR